MHRILCFGQLTVLKDGVALPPGAVQPRRLGLLALLAASGDRAQSRERLASLLWPESDEERARGSLAQAVYALRRDLGSDESIQGVRDLRLNPDFVSADLWDFETHRGAGSLDRAVECYSGPFLSGFQLPGLPEFDRWLETERAAWAGRHLEVVEKLAVAAEQQNDRAGAVRWWRRAAGQEPHNARVTVRLMRAMARGGDRPGALRQAEIYAALLDRDLELPPDAAVLKEADAIRNAEVAAHVTGDWPVPTPAEPVPAEAPIPGGVAAVPALSEVPALPRRRSRLRWPLSLVVTAVAVLAAVKLWPGGTVPPEARRLMVVPLRNNTGDSTFALVGPMVAEWITRGLSETGLVDVIDSRTMLEATRDAGDSASIRELALGAGVGTLVMGSVYKEGDRLRFEVRLTDAGTIRVAGGVIPSVYAPVSSPTAALEPLRQRVTGALALMFDIQLPNLRATASQPPTWEAYQEFLLGMRDFGVDYESALTHFRRAAELDTTYWQARMWVGSSSSNSRRYPAADSIFRSLAAMRDRLGAYDRATLDYFSSGFVYGDWERSYQAAREMVRLAPGAGHPLFALGNTAQITHRPQEAIEALRRINVERGWGTAWAQRILSVISRAQNRLGKYEDELATGRLMRETDEGLGWVRLTEIRALAALKRTDELERRLESAMSLPITEASWEPFIPGDMLVQAGRELRAHGDSAGGRLLFERSERWYRSLTPAEQMRPGNRRAVVRVMLHLGRWSQSVAAYRALLETDSSSVEHLGGLGVAAAHLGDSATAVGMLEQLRNDRTPYRFGQPALWAARIAASLGRNADAVALLYQATRSGFARVYQLHAEPELAGLRNFAPFQELLRPKG